MSLLDKASLIVTPNAYKASKLYSVIPNTTLGDMTVVRATTATRVNSAGLIESVAVNVPRIDYTNGSCPSLLVEPQRTNLFLSSQQFDDANWGKAVGTITANVAISPDGTQNADLFNNANIYQQRTQANNTTYCFSVYVKKNTASNIVIGYIDNNVGFAGGDINYTYLTNTITVSQSANGSVSAQSIDVGNGWIRLILKYTTIATVTFNYQLIISDGSYVYGAQLEVGSYPTSYIQTVASTVTRNADVISKTGISSLIGQTEGTLFSSFYYSGNAINGIQIYPLYIGQGTYVDSVSIGLYDNALLCRVFTSGVAQNYFTSSALSIGNHKVAFVYANNNLKLFLDGVLIATDTLATIPTCNQVYSGSAGTTTDPEKININNNLIFKTALTDAECIALTTL